MKDCKKINKGMTGVNKHMTSRVGDIFQNEFSEKHLDFLYNTFPKEEVDTALKHRKRAIIGNSKKQYVASAIHQDKIASRINQKITNSLNLHRTKKVSMDVNGARKIFEGMFSRFKNVETSVSEGFKNAINVGGVKATDVVAGDIKGDLLNSMLSGKSTGNVEMDKVANASVTYITQTLDRASKALGTTITPKTYIASTAMNSGALYRRYFGDAELSKPQRIKEFLTGKEDRIHLKFDEMGVRLHKELLDIADFIPEGKSKDKFAQDFIKLFGIGDNSTARANGAFGKANALDMLIRTWDIPEEKVIAISNLGNPTGVEVLSTINGNLSKGMGIAESFGASPLTLIQDLRDAKNFGAFGKYTTASGNSIDKVFNEVENAINFHMGNNNGGTSDRLRYFNSFVNLSTAFQLPFLAPIAIPDAIASVAASSAQFERGLDNKGKAMMETIKAATDKEFGEFIGRMDSAEKAIFIKTAESMMEVISDSVNTLDPSSKMNREGALGVLSEVGYSLSGLDKADSIVKKMVAKASYVQMKGMASLGDWDSIMLTGKESQKAILADAGFNKNSWNLYQKAQNSDMKLKTRQELNDLVGIEIDKMGKEAFMLDPDNIDFKILEKLFQNEMNDMLEYNFSEFGGYMGKSGKTKLIENSASYFDRVGNEGSAEMLRDPVLVEDFLNNGSIRLDKTESIIIVFNEDSLIKQSGLEEEFKSSIRENYRQSRDNWRRENVGDSIRRLTASKDLSHIAELNARISKMLDNEKYFEIAKKSKIDEVLRASEESLISMKSRLNPTEQTDYQAGVSFANATDDLQRAINRLMFHFKRSGIASVMNHFARLNSHRELGSEFGDLNKQERAADLAVMASMAFVAGSALEVGMRSTSDLVTGEDTLNEYFENFGEYPAQAVLTTLASGTHFSIGGGTSRPVRNAVGLGTGLGLYLTGNLEDANEKMGNTMRKIVTNAPTDGLLTGLGLLLE